MKTALTGLLVSFFLCVCAGDNLFRGGNFTPVKMDGADTAAKGWNWIDYGRMNHNWWSKSKKDYLSGYQCFKLSFENDAMTVAFYDKVTPDYFKQQHCMYNSSGRMPTPEAAEFRISGEALLNAGSFIIAEKLRLNPSPEWQKFDLKITADEYRKLCRQNLFRIKPEPGMKISFRNFRLETVYPVNKTDSIRLADGGKLTKIILPESASFELKYLAECWRSWLWRLTGVVLPIVEGKAVPTKGALVFVKGKTAPGGWKIDAKSDGITVVWNEVESLSPALYDYIRLAGVYLASHDSRKIPTQDRSRVLPAVSKNVVPRFHWLNNTPEHLGVSWNLASSAVDWYTWDHPIWDHHMNTLLPVEAYRDKHPEYYMLTDDGKRQNVKYQFYMSPCLSNADAKDIIERRFSAMTAGMDYKKQIGFTLGDRPDFCHCGECRKDKGFYTDVMLGMVNRLARRIAKEQPGMTVNYSAYLLLRQPPRKVVPEKNVVVHFCLPPFNWPCNVHVECKENLAGMNELKAWSKITGPAKLATSGYEEARPWHHLKQLEFLNRYSSAFYHTYCGEPQIHYITGRWNVGDSPDQAIAEFNDVYYGPAGKYITEVERTIENFTETYKHRAGEISSAEHNITVMSWVFARKTVIDRELFDKLYPLLDKAVEAAAKCDVTTRGHVWIAYFKILRMDLAKYRATDCGTAAETAAFAKRLIKFVSVAEHVNTLKLKFPENGIQQTLMHGAPARLFLKLVAGIDLPETVKDWTQEPKLKKFLENPEKHLILKPNVIPGGVVFLPGLMRGGKGPNYYAYQCPRKLVKSINRPSSGQSELTVTFQLDRVPASPLMLVVEGLDDDKPGASTMSVKVNGNEIFAGANTFAENDWTKMNFAIPVHALKAGDNVVSIADTVPDRKGEAVDDGEIFTGQSGIQNYQWGWICISKISVLDPSSAFQNYLKDGKAPWSIINWMCEPKGIVETRDGKLFILSKGAPFTGIYFQVAKENRIALKGGEGIRLSVRASGVGRVGFWAYDKNSKYVGNECVSLGYDHKTSAVKSEVFHLPKNAKTTTVIPFVIGSKQGTSVESVSFEIIQDAPKK